MGHPWSCGLMECVGIPPGPTGQVGEQMLWVRAFPPKQSLDGAPMVVRIDGCMGIPPGPKGQVGEQMLWVRAFPPKQSLDGAPMVVRIDAV